MFAKKRCGCNVCRFNNEPINTRTIRAHNSKYGTPTLDRKPNVSGLRGCGAQISTVTYYRFDQNDSNVLPFEVSHPIDELDFRLYNIHSCCYHMCGACY
jgi:hypothetical protein